jgi:crotonobetainyl-CoA:carnitine CoA-transferase CaiB-like acyl-CoA transferase
MPSDVLPLTGTRVLDLTQVMFGPSATQVLADHGADVIKIERPGVGDLIRGIDQMANAHGGESAYFLALNRNKRSVTVDLQAPAGRELVRELLGEIDVLVHNFRPGVAERLGLGYAELAEEFPRLIHASGSGFGADGPLAAWGGQDMLAQSVSGVAMHARDESGRPTLHPVSFADFTAGMVLVQGILLALLHRERTGVGQHVHVSLLDTMIAAQMQEITQWTMRRFEPNFANQYLAGVFRAQDGWFTLVGLFRPQPLRSVCAAFDTEDLSQRPEFASPELELENRARLFPLLEEVFLRHSVQDCLDRLQAADVLCAPVLDYDQLLAHPQVLRNDMLWDLDTPDGVVRTTGTPLHLSAVPRHPRQAPPRLGEHTAEVLLELGVSAPRIADLEAAGVLGPPQSIAGTRRAPAVSRDREPN